MKKILSMMLALCMIATMLTGTIFVSADEATETTNEPYSLIKWSFDTLTPGTKVTKGSFAHDEGANLTGSSDLTLRNFAPTNKSTDTVVVEDTVNGGSYIKTAHSRLGSNYARNIDAQIASSGNPVVSISYDIMIPDEGNLYKENLRNGSFGIGATAEGGTEYVILIAPKIHKGKIFAGVSDTNVVYSEKLDYTYGDWVTFKVLAWENEDSKITVAIYSDDTLIWYGESDNSTNGMALSSTMDLRYNSDAADSTGSGTDGTSYTCYDNVHFQLLPESTKVDVAYVNGLVAAQKEATPYARLFEYTCDKLSSNAGAVSGKAVFPTSGIYSGNMAQGSATDVLETSAYAVVTDADRTYTNVTYSSYKYLINAFRGSFSEYVKKGNGDKSVFVYESDVKLKDFNAPVSGFISFGLDLNSSAYTNDDGVAVAKRHGNDLVVTYSIDTDGSFGFTDAVYHTAGRVVDAKRSEERTVTPGEWINTKMVFEITHSAAQYDIKVYGIYNDAVIYENEFYITYKDYDFDGITDDIHINSIALELGTDDNPNTVTVTGVDNIYFEKNNNFDWSAIDTDAWLNRYVELSKDVSGNIDVYAKNKEGFTNGILVMAIYDVNGALVEDGIITSTDIEDKAFSYKIPAAKVAGAKTVKAFVLDAMTSAVPLIGHGEFVIE